MVVQVVEQMQVALVVQVVVEITYQAVAQELLVKDMAAAQVQLEQVQALYAALADDKLQRPKP